MILHVAVDGNDTNPGTASHPLGTLAGAKSAVRKLLGTTSEDIRVQFRGGTYRITETVVFSLEDSAGGERSVSYEAYPGEKPVLDAGILLTGWEKTGDTTACGDLPEAAKGHVWVAALPVRPNGDFTFNSLFTDGGTRNGGQRISRARGKGFAFDADDSIPEENQWDTCRIPSGSMEAWPDIDNCELVVIPRFTWTMNILPIKSYDADTRLLQTSVPCTYLLQPNGRPETVWVENVLAVMTEPGSWVADYSGGKIYYWPEDGAPEEGIVVPGLTEIVRVEGKIDYDGPTDEMVENLRFEGLSFTHAGRYPFHGQTGWGMQHDWEAFDRPTAMVRFRGASRCGLNGCEFSHSDGTGVRFDLSCSSNDVTRSTFEDLGGCAIVLGGYGPGMKDTNRLNTIQNNHIHHTGIINWHSPGVFVWQSGVNTISHNHIHHTPYTGIVVSGRIRLNRLDQRLQGVVRPGKAECFNTIRWEEVEPILGHDYEMPVWHEPSAWKDDWDRRKQFLHCRNNLLEYNDIHDVMQIMGDGNGVYISGTGAGNRVRYNAVHDCPSKSMAEALRCDDDQHETILHGNLIYRIGGMATGITTKGINTITNNIVAHPMSGTARGLISLEVGPLDGSTIKRNILLTNSSEQAYYFQYRRIHGKGPAPLLRDCDSDYNLYWCAEDPSRCDKLLEEEREYGNDRNSRAADPLFVDPDAADYTLADDSPAWALGFRRLELEKIGII
jgi:hypothetical protein